MKKTLSLLPIVIVLIGVFTSCASNGSDTPTDVTSITDETTNNQNDNEAVDVTTRTPLAVMTADYSGYEFKILEFKQTETGARQFLDFGWSVESAGELINDAVYNRNLIVEEHYNVVIKSIEDENVNTTATKSILAGSDEYDVYMNYINNTFVMAQENLLIDLYTMPGLDITNEWWDQAMIRDLAIAGVMPSITGDITMADEELNYCIFFNKTVQREYNIDDLYQIVRDDKWDIDKISEIGRIVTHDINGDGIIDSNDSYGILTDYSVSPVWFYSLGGQIAQLDNNGQPSIVLYNPQSIDRIEKLNILFNDSNIVLNASDKALAPGAWTDFNNMLMSDRALFRVGSVYNIQQYRDMVNDFGILPYPKFNDNQDEFYHIIASQLCASVSIPQTASDLERTGILLEALAYESKETITKAYYDINLYTKVSRDDESGEMFDIIFAAKRYDLAKVFNWGTAEKVIENSVKNGDFASLYASAESVIITAMQNSYQFFLNLEK